MSTWHRLAPKLGALVVLIGCGSDDRVQVHPVKGQVFHRGQPAAGALVVLHPQEESEHDFSMGYPRGTVDETGKFSLSTYQADDGAPVGNYTVTIEWRLPVAEDVEELGPDKLRGTYADPGQSGLTATIQEGENDLSPFQLP